MRIHFLRCCLGTLLTVLSLAGARAESGEVPFVVSPGLSEDATLSSRVAELLVRLGAPIRPQEVSPGQATHILDGKTAACGLTVLRGPPEREHFRWIARSAEDSIVIASPREAGDVQPGPGDYVAAFYVKALLEAAERAGVKVIPIYSFDQIDMILKTGRTRFVLGLQTQIDQINGKYKVDLAVTREIQPVVTWVACNGAVGEDEAAAIGAVWRKAYDEGSLRQVYASAGMEKVLPPP